MSTNAQAILEKIQGLPPAELRELCQQINRMAAAMEKLSSPSARIADAEFETALEEVTGCTAGRSSLQRLLDDRRRDREQDEALLKARKMERAGLALQPSAR